MPQRVRVAENMARAELAAMGKTHPGDWRYMNYDYE